MKNESVRFEDHVYPSVRRRLPASLGWEPYQERTMNTGGRADYAFSRYKYAKKERAVVEAKNVKELTFNHVDQLDEYARAFHATHRYVAVPRGTYVSEDVKDYMYDLDIDLIRTRFKKRAK